jgi:hypothetical protein
MTTGTLIGRITRTLFSGLWTDIAQFYKDYSYRVIFEIDNEPFHGTTGYDNTDLIEMMQIGWNAVRGTGGKNLDRLIMLTCFGANRNPGSTYPNLQAVNQVTGGDNDHVIMTVHSYNPWTYCGYAAEETNLYDEASVVNDLRTLATWSESTGIPVHLGEFGVSWRVADRYADGLLLPDMNADQVWWYALVYHTCAVNGLSFSIWDDNGWYRFLNRYTLEFVSTIDVVQGVPQTPYLGTPATIPGTIQVVEYDNGGEQVAYHDTTSGDEGSSNFRNDDVDGGTNTIGWFEDGEWLAYTVDVVTGGTYSVALRASSAGGGGTLHIEFDGTNKTGVISLPDTGDWGSFVTVAVSNVALTAGEQVMRVVKDSGSFNLSTGISFVLQPISWSEETVSEIGETVATASVAVSANLIDTVLVWDVSDQGTSNTNDWAYRLGLGVQGAGMMTTPITGLSAGTAYSFRYFGVDALNNSAWSAPVSFATHLSTAQAPVFANAVALSASSIRLDWQDNASTETGYILQRSTTASGGYTQIASPGASAASYVDTELAEATTYYYRLAVTNSMNGSGTDLQACQTNATTLDSPSAYSGPLSTYANDTFDVCSQTTGDDGDDPLDLGWSGSAGFISVVNDTAGIGFGNALAYAPGGTWRYIEAPFPGAILQEGQSIEVTYDLRFEEVPPSQSVGLRLSVSGIDNASYSMQLSYGGATGSSLFYLPQQSIGGEGALIASSGAMPGINDTIKHRLTFRAYRHAGSVTITAGLDGNAYSGVDTNTTMITRFNKILIGCPYHDINFRIDNVTVRHSGERLYNLDWMRSALGLVSNAATDDAWSPVAGATNDAWNVIDVGPNVLTDYTIIQNDLIDFGNCGSGIDVQVTPVKVDGYPHEDPRSGPWISYATTTNANGTGPTITISSLNDQKRYDLICYIGHSRWYGAGGAVGADFTFGGQTRSASESLSQSPMPSIEGETYVRFRNLKPSGGIISGTFGVGPTATAVFSALQLVELPLPPSGTVIVVK